MPGRGATIPVPEPGSSSAGGQGLRSGPGSPVLCRILSRTEERKLKAMLLGNLRELYRHRELLVTLARRSSLRWISKR